MLRAQAVWLLPVLCWLSEALNLLWLDHQAPYKGHSSDSAVSGLGTAAVEKEKLQVCFLALY